VGLLPEAIDFIDPLQLSNIVGFLKIDIILFFWTM